MSSRFSFPSADPHTAGVLPKPAPQTAGYPHRFSAGSSYQGHHPATASISPSSGGYVSHPSWPPYPDQATPSAPPPSSIFSAYRPDVVRRSSAAFSVSAPGTNIYDRHLGRTRNAEVSASALQFLFAEMVNYTQNRVSGITDLERKLSLFGYHIGQRVLAIATHRQESSAKTPRRETKLLAVLLFVHTQVWKAAFGKPADSLEKSTEQEDEYMISYNVPIFSKSITVPRDLSQLSTEAITAGIVEAALDGLGFPARVTAHSVPTDQYPARTTILIKLDPSVMARESALDDGKG